MQVDPIWPNAEQPRPWDRKKRERNKKNRQKKYSREKKKSAGEGQGKVLLEGRKKGTKKATKENKDIERGIIKNGKMEKKKKRKERGRASATMT